MGTLNYNTLRPFAQAKTGLPRLIQPYEEINGKINGNKFQYQPSDHPNNWKDGGNLHDYTEDECMYTVNQYGFRGNEFVLNAPTLMTAGCSHTYGIGVKDNEVWGSKLADSLNMYHLNLGVGGIGCDTVALLIKQCFEEGLVPNVLCVLWPYIDRKMLIGDNAKPLDNQVLDFIVNEQNTKIEPFIYQFAPGNPTPEDKQAQMLFKAHLMQSEQQRLLESWMWRELVIELCKHHNVQLVEGFVSDIQFEHVKEKCNKNIPRLPNSINYLRNVDWDLARDNMHFGKYGHDSLSKLFVSEIVL